MMQVYVGVQADKPADKMHMGRQVCMQAVRQAEA